MDRERRVALSPAGVAALLKAGFKDVLVQSSAGEAAKFKVCCSSPRRILTCLHSGLACRHCHACLLPESAICLHERMDPSHNLLLKLMERAQAESVT